MKLRPTLAMAANAPGSSRWKSLIFSLSLCTVALVCSSHDVIGQSAAATSRPEQSDWVTNDQLLGVLNMEYQVNVQQDWLVVTEGANMFFIQANSNFPEIRMMQAWGNTVGITPEELNELNQRLNAGRLFISSEGKIQLVLEHSYHGMKMSTLGLIHSINRFRSLRDAVVEMIANL